MTARALLVAALALGATSCRSPAPKRADGGADTDGGLLDLVGLGTSCLPQRATLVRGNVGPDVNVHLPCYCTVDIPVASVDVEGDGSTLWSISLTGDPAFSFQRSPFVTCQSTSPTLATVLLGVPNTSGPGTTFDAVATVRSDDGSFPTGKVNIHAQVVAPQFTLSQTSVDFGDVLPDQMVVAEVTANSAFPQAVATPTSVTSVAFRFTQSVKEFPGSNAPGTAQLTFAAHDVGDYTATWLWTAGVETPAGCATTKTVALHARVVAPDAGAGDGGG